MFTTRQTLSAFALAAPLALFAGSASAGGLAEPVVTPVAPTPHPVVVVAPSADWTGFYAGGSLGYGQLEGAGLGDDFSGTIYSGHAGYNYDLGAFVVGAEIEATLGDLSDATSGLTFENVLRAKARAGYDAGALMPYVTAGRAQATVSAGGADIDDTGYFYGGGVDYNMGNGLTVGGEVLQHAFDDFHGGEDVNALTAGLRVSYNF